MKKYSLTYGLLAGIIVSVFMITSMLCYHKDMNFEKYGLIIGYGGMLMAFSMVFVGIKKYKANIGNGYISFGKAFIIGLYITLIASTMYVISWMIEYYVFIPDFMDIYAAKMLENAKTLKLSASEMAAKLKEIESYKAMYKSPVMVALLTYFEIVPVGLLIALISALVLKKKENITT